jgi:hypothetical protein
MSFTNLKELIEAAQSDDLEKVQSFCNLPIDSPEQKDIDEALHQSAIHFSDKVFNYLYKFNKPSPSENEVSTLLIEMCNLEDRPKKWGIIGKLCTLIADQKLNQDAIDTALIALSKASKWELVMLIWDKFIEGNSQIVAKPNIIKTVLKSALLQENHDIIQYLWQIKMTPDSIRDGLIDTIVLGNLKIFQTLYKSVINIDQITIDELFLKAVEWTKPAIVTYLYINRKRPSELAIKEATIQAAEQLERNPGEDIAQIVGYLKNRTIIPKHENLNNGSQRPFSYTNSQTLFRQVDSTIMQARHEPQPLRKSCFSDEQLEAINNLINELDTEINSCCSFFNPYLTRKENKKTSLEKMIEDSYGEQTDVISLVRNAVDTCSDLRKGMFSRTADLLDGIVFERSVNILG